MMPEQVNVIRQKLREIQREVLQKLDYDETGWVHYTSQEGFHNIIESGQLWCTDIRCVNDSREGDHGQDVVRSVVLRKSVPGEFKDKVNRSNNLFGLKEIWTIYIACFCSAGEQQHMWEDYGRQSTGYAIEFSHTALYAGADNGKAYALLPILYSRPDQEQLIETMVDHVIRLDHEVDLPRRNRRDFWFIEVPLVLMGCAVMFKDSSWSREAEQRIMVVGGDDAEPFVANGKSRVRINFDRNAVTRVIIGKHNEVHANPDSVREFLEGCGYGSNVGISSATA